MALSFYSDYIPFQANNNFPESLNSSPELFHFNNQSFEDFSETSIDPLFNSVDGIYDSDCYANLLPYFSSPERQVSLLPEIFTVEDFRCEQQTKRVKTSEHCVQMLPSLFDGHCDFVQGFFTRAPAVPELHASADSNRGHAENDGKQNGVSLSTQSIAARERRRKISEKTRQLGNLIPGGNKMNTAEMFLAAFKYVKFLQAQVQTLELVNSIQGKTEEPMNGRELQAALLASSRIQEKLYLEDKCLVPIEFGQNIGSEEGNLSEHLIPEQIDHTS